MMRACRLLSDIRHHSPRARHVVRVRGPSPRNVTFEDDVRSLINRKLGSFIEVREIGLEERQGRTIGDTQGVLRGRILRDRRRAAETDRGARDRKALPQREQ
jgi:hypothetical protein